MKESIYTIPINEAFEAEEISRTPECPFCKLETAAENKNLDYIMGAAMMEPDVRETINITGFCSAHYRRMLNMNNRLSLALTLESRIKKIRDLTMPLKAGDHKASEKLALSTDSCYVCQRTQEMMEHYYSNMLEMWRTEDDFRKRFTACRGLCVHHFSALATHASKQLHRKQAVNFLIELSQKEDLLLEESENIVNGFCKSFDYRSKGVAFDSLAVEKAVKLLTGKDYLQEKR